MPVTRLALHALATVVPRLAVAEPLDAAAEQERKDHRSLPLLEYDHFEFLVTRWPRCPGPGAAISRMNSFSKVILVGRPAAAEKV